MINPIYKILPLLLLSVNVNAQYARFAKSGVITYEKRGNTHALVKKTINKSNEGFMQKRYEEYVRNEPQFKTANLTLTFSETLSLYQPDENTVVAKDNFLIPAFEQNNTVYSDFTKKLGISQKTVFEETFLVKDSLRNISWKITEETREIAGYECRRANAIIMDSIYVVAFYTDEILVSGGPESFNGLPGMILGLALPHEHLTWFATKVVARSVSTNELNPPIKGNVLNRKTFETTLEKSLKSYYAYFKQALVFFLL